MTRRGAQGSLRAGAWLARDGRGRLLRAWLQGRRVGPPEEMDCSRSAQPLGRAGTRSGVQWLMITQVWAGVPATLQLPLFLEPPPAP